MVAKKRRPRLDDAKLPQLLTPEIVRERFVAQCSLPENVEQIVGDRMVPFEIMRDPDAKNSEKQRAWESVVSRLGLAEEQAVKHSGGLSLSAVGTLDVYVHDAGDECGVVGAE